MSTFFGRRPEAPVPPPPPPSAPTRADATMPDLPTRPSSLISSGSASGLKRKASTQKRSLLG